MSYTSIASEVKNSNSTYTSYVSSNFKTTDFSSVWSGPAATTLLNDLTSVIDKVTQNNSNVDSFVNALKDLDTYKKKKEDIDSKESILSTTRTQLSNTPDTEANTSRISKLRNKVSSLQTEIYTLENDAKTLRQKIVSALNSISSISSSITSKSSIDVSSDLDGYVVDLYDLLSTFQSGKLSTMNGNLYNYYSKEEVQSTLDTVKNQYSGRDAAVNSALSVISLASAKGVKLDYQWGGGHTSETSLDAVAAGTDCSAFVSWAINQGTDATFHTETTSGLITEGKQTSFENAKKGDILVSGGHAILIVDNDASTKTFLVAEASSPSEGVVLRTRSYSSIYGEYQARDLSSLYG